MSTTNTTIESHRANLTKLYRAKERLNSVRFRGQHHEAGDTEDSVLAEIRALEKTIACERTQNLQHWTQVTKSDRYGTTTYKAWEPSSLFQHSSFSSSAVPAPDGSYWGPIGCRPLPQDIEDMRGGSPERIAAVTAWNAAENREAYLAIVGRYPEAAAGEMKHGQITVKEQG